MKFPAGRPSFFESIEALRLDARPSIAHVFPTEDELDAADALELIHQHHYSDSDRESPDGSWGTCEGCSDVWPCKTWLWGQQLAVQWIGRAHTRYSAGTTVTMAATAEQSRELGALPTRSSTIDVIHEVERKRLRDLRSVPVTPAPCRHPDCRTVVSVQHPLAGGWLHDVVCADHAETTASRYQLDDWSAHPTHVPTPGRCASCSAPISTAAEWCCEPCVTSGGHARGCSAMPRLHVVKEGSPDE